MAKDVWYLRHGGGYIGGVIIVVADNLDEAIQLIQKTFDDNQFKKDEYDLSNIIRVSQYTSRVEYFTDGDY